MAATLSPVVWMIAGAVGSATAAGLVTAPDVRAAIVLGMVGPLAATIATWVAVEHAYRRDPLAVTGVMLRAWLLKALFFTIYLIAVIRGLGVSGQPFAVSLASYFLVLHTIEAMLLKRLFSRAWRPARS
jgi:ACR3 family arsenite efflux pump ArsB